MRFFHFASAALLSALSFPVLAVPLVSVTDADPINGSGALLQTSCDIRGCFSNAFAVEWTQSVATSNVAVTATLTNGSGHWWVTNALGPTATLANVIASGVFSSPGGSSPPPPNFNIVSPQTLATGLNFTPGTYYLVLDGGAPTGPSRWLADTVAGTSVSIVPEFALASVYSTGDPSFGAAATFAPSSTNFTPLASARFAFGLDGIISPIPEPATWLTLLMGFAALGMLLRRKAPSAGQVMN